MAVDPQLIRIIKNKNYNPWKKEVRFGIPSLDYDINHCYDVYGLGFLRV